MDKVLYLILIMEQHTQLLKLNTRYITCSYPLISSTIYTDTINYNSCPSDLNIIFNSGFNFNVKNGSTNYLQVNTTNTTINNNLIVSHFSGNNYWLYANSSKQIVENTNIQSNGANLTIVNNATGSCSIEMGSTTAYLPSFIDMHCPTNTDYALRFIQNTGTASLDGSSYITKNGGWTSITQLSFNINCNKAYCDINLTVYTNSNINFQTSNITRVSINDKNTTISNNLLLSSYSGTPCDN